ncbi:calmodulin [Eurytemora carolleeae]|uniref:calmodulin n=1 Tax=Eurytemora carolleeae TaxID=1294199 RepID=UPI000C781998|nr:calmodulin [Eurytemora carolleeae]|eukprot:XP_023332417.1 calmodulin-like [Eurytemora affinis]
MSKGGSNVLMVKKSKINREQHALEEAFERADKNGDGRLSIEEYYDILKSHSISTTQSEILHLLDIADKDNDGFITKDEFIHGQAKENDLIAAQEKARLAFNFIDKNRDGYITKNEMLATIKKLTTHQVDAVFYRNDHDGDGKLSQEEFTNMMIKEHK